MHRRHRGPAVGAADGGGAGRPLLVPHPRYPCAARRDGGYRGPAGPWPGLCPITEANLGDGVFPLPAFLTLGGRFGIGSDSNVALNPWEELRLLEYGQRLVHGRRCLSLPEDGTGSVGGALFRAALAGGGCGPAPAGGRDRNRFPR